MESSIRGLGAGLLVLALAAGASAQESRSRAKAESSQTAGIAWYGTWKQGLAAAKRLKRPILLIAAAPHCRNVSGLW